MGARGIPTTIDGIEYRSRLEARWATFFGQIGWRFVYEPIDGDRYLPDFAVLGAHPMMVEVKPALTAADYRAPIAKVTRGLGGHWEGDILIAGAAPLPGGLGNGVDTFDDYRRPLAGLLGEFFPAPDVLGGADSWRFGGGAWFICSECGVLAVQHQMDSSVGRPCGHYERDDDTRTDVAVMVAKAWATATNLSKWNAA